MFFKTLRSDIDSMMARDPAARSRLEVVFCYPGFHAVLIYRLAHGAWRRGFHLLGRWLSHLGRFLTGIEIHPGAELGERLFIDHGMAVVIGETAVIGNDVTLYQGVTLGGTSLKGGKRHPTLQDNVIVGAGAQVLGPITVGEGARIGANAVVLKDVTPGATMVGIPARPVVAREASLRELAHRATYDGSPVDAELLAEEFRHSSDAGMSREGFVAYGTPSADLPDPVARAIDSLAEQLNTLKARIDELERTSESELEPDEAAQARSKAYHG
jgi:serine O-acetyltransferase